MRILLLEDERNLAGSIREGLMRRNFSIDWAETGERGLVWAKVNDYDLGIFDIRLAGTLTGIDVCRETRAAGRTYPIIMLTVTGDAATKVRALNIGADDYLSKPFVFSELLARANALLRRERKVTGPVLIIHDLVVDIQMQSVVRAGKTIRITRKQFALLEYFMRNPGVILTRSMILEHVWDMNADPFTNTVDVHMRYLRQKIDDPFKKKLLHTVHGYGYKIEAPV